MNVPVTDSSPGRGRRPTHLAAPELRALALVLAATVGCGVVACDSSGSASPGGAGGGAGSSGGPGSGGGASGSGGSTVIAPSCTGEAEHTEPVSTVLPGLPELTNVRACTTGDAVTVTFDPLDPAVDYRIYPLPADADVTIGADGSVVVKNAIYRCAGQREALYMIADEPGALENASGGTTTVNGDVQGYTRSEAEARLGYVYPTAAAGRVPVFALGDPNPSVDSSHAACGFPMFDSTRPKIYTTDAEQRDRLIEEGARDDGIAFYAPEAGGPGTRPVYEGPFGDGVMLRWIDGAEGSARGPGTKVFDVLTADEPGAVPLMRVHVAPYCATPHDELVATMTRFRKVRDQGDQPLTALRWSGLTDKTVLVVEALDQGCPYQGNLSPEHLDAWSEEFAGDYEPFLTIDDMRAASPTGEVFINGQYEGAPEPKAIGRSFVSVAPKTARMDFSATFPVAQDLRKTFEEVPSSTWGYARFVSKDYDFTSEANSHVFFGSMLGELWVAYNDVSADVNGKIRLTAQKKATLSRDTFLHVTMEVDIIATPRRYPQILISDQAAPVQANLVHGKTLIVQPKDSTPTLMQVQICDHRHWEVNDQCPMLPTLSAAVQPVARVPAELAGTDYSAKLDVYVSTQRVYLFMNDAPYSCTALPATADDGQSYTPPEGPVTVTWGDVLYHSGVDFTVAGAPIPRDNAYRFHQTHMLKTTRRHFDNIGFSSGVPRPSWDESRIPCIAEHL
jgi:hypothetical protein